MEENELLTPNLNVNRTAWNLTKKMCAQAEKFGVIVKKTKSGATLIDAGIEAVRSPNGVEA